MDSKHTFHSLKFLQRFLHHIQWRMLSSGLIYSPFAAFHDALMSRKQNKVCNYLYRQSHDFELPKLQQTFLHFDWSQEMPFFETIGATVGTEAKTTLPRDRDNLPYTFKSFLPKVWVFLFLVVSLESLLCFFAAGSFINQFSRFTTPHLIPWNLHSHLIWLCV